MYIHMLCIYWQMPMILLLEFFLLLLLPLQQNQSHGQRLHRLSQQGRVLSLQAEQEGDVVVVMVVVREMGQEEKEEG